MTMNWREYQEYAADFFRKLGLRATVEAAVHGVRGNHKIDVYVTGAFYGINFSWVIECKAWKDNVPKEKVLALMSIVQDVGADRGYLLSEKGFQSGALQAARNTNIILSSVEELSELTREFRIETVAADRTLAIRQALNRLMEFKRQSERAEYDFTRLTASSELRICETLLGEAIQKKFPILYPTKGLEFADFDQVVAYIDQCIGAANKWVPDES